LCVRWWPVSADVICLLLMIGGLLDGDCEFVAVGKSV